MRYGIIRKAAFCLTLLAVSVMALAQEVIVQPSPVQQVLPPQVMLYIDNPGRYFNVQVVNRSQKTQNIYFGLRVEQLIPSSGLYVEVPVDRMPQRAITLAAGQTRQLTMVELKTLFNHVVKSEVKASSGLIGKFDNGSFGLLPEGTYRATLTAYEWNPAMATPRALSNPQAGRCIFQVCYKAQAPQFQNPIAVSTGPNLRRVAELSLLNPLFAWSQPLLACNSRAQSYTYDFRIVELMLGQQPDDAIDRNPVVYRVQSLTAPQVIVPQQFANRLAKDKTYVAQVKATPANRSTGSMSYTLINNDGKSNYLLFTVVDNRDVPENKPKTPDTPEIPDTPESPENPESPETPDTLADRGGAGVDTNVYTEYTNKDSTYVFKKPDFLSPQFEEGMARKIFVESEINVQWRHPLYVGGTGERQDTVKFNYDVELYLSEIGQSHEYLFKNKQPIYSKTIKEGEGYKQTIPWKKLAEKDVRTGCYMVLRVNPKSPNAKSIRFVDGEENVVDFAIAEHLSTQYFTCTDQVKVTNTTPTKLKDGDLKGKTVHIGQYNLTIGEIKKVSGKDYYQGKGHVEWNPMGTKVMVAVKYDSLKINTDNIVYGGNAVTYQSEEEYAKSGMENVDKLFSDWGIDNLVGDTQIGYSQEVMQQASSNVKNSNSIQNKTSMAQYHFYVSSGGAKEDKFLKAEISDLHLPVGLPKSVNPTPVNIQIVSMKFTPTSATMNLMGEFTLPSCNTIKNDILILGAPRLCVSPNELLPESGTMALLGDFTVQDPETTFDMTFKAPSNVLEPSNGCFVSWKANKFEMFDIDVEMTIPDLVKVDDAGNRTDANPKLEFHASITDDWDDWCAEARMDNFEVKDLKDWTFLPGNRIIYDHSKKRNADNMPLPVDYDKEKAGMAKNGEDASWQGLFVRSVGVVFPKMLSVNDKDKNWNGRLKLDVENMFFDDSGCSLQMGMDKVFSFETGSVGGWGISMDTIRVEILQNSFKTAFFNGEIKTPLEGQIRYDCNMYFQGKDAEGVTDPKRTAYVFKTQQVKGLKFDFWLGEMDFQKDQTYFLVEAESTDGKDAETKVELCMGGRMDITIGRSWLRSQGKVGAYVDAAIPGVQISGMRIANCERWKSNYTQNQYEAPEKGGMNKFFGWDAEYNIKEKDFYFSLGRWSLAFGKKDDKKGGGGGKPGDAAGGGTASTATAGGKTTATATAGGGTASAATAGGEGSSGGEAGKLGPFDMTLDQINFSYSEKKARLTLGVKVAVMEGMLSADCALDIVAKVNTDKMSMTFDDVEFHKAAFDSEFGGISVKGELEASKGEDDGYKGALEFKMPGDFLGFKFDGGYFNRKTATEKYTWGYFVGEVSSSTGIRLDPIVITKIKGGVYFNCKAPTVMGIMPTANDAKKGVYGAMLGIGLATSGGENMLSSEMELSVCYDTEREKLSSLIMNGTLDALKPSSEGKGMVNAHCQLAYVNDVERYIQINVTASGENALDKPFRDKLEELTGKAFEYGKEVKQGLEDFGKDDSGKKSTEADKSKDPNKTSFKASMGFQVTLDFKVTFTEGERCRWHVYVGEPPYDKRCKLTLIDFQAGKKSDSFAAWAYLGSTMYFCLGNELPEGGLPPIPPMMRDFLDGTDVNGKKQSESSMAENGRQNEMNKMVGLINSQEVAGGLMVGANAEGDFGVNAGVVYAHGAFTYGFDLVLEKFKDGATCQGGRKMGYHGWYGMGQAYGMLKGDMGVKINLWFVKKDVSLIDLGLGALLQAGLPNPTWVYGKVRARCSLLGGLFKFNHAIELKAGDVCMPDYGDPLDNIKIFSSAYPGDSIRSEGMKTETSVYAQPNFITNFDMNRDIRLVDRNKAENQIQNDGVEESEARANAERLYQFQLGTMTLKNKTTAGKDKVVDAEKVGTSLTDYRLKCGPLEPNTDYELELTAYAKEWSTKESRWVNPTIDGKQQEKKETVTYYFRTGPLEPNIVDGVKLALPGKGKEDLWVRHEDAVRPRVSLDRHRTDLTGRDSEYRIEWRLYKENKLLETKTNSVYTGPGGKYEVWRPASEFTQVKAGEEGKYQIRIMRITKDWEKAELSKKKETKKTVKKQATAEGVQSARDVGQPSVEAESSLAARMNEYFANEEADMAASSVTTTTRTATEEASTEGELCMYIMKFGKTVNTTFKNEKAFKTHKEMVDHNGYDYEHIYMAVNTVGRELLLEWEKPYQDELRLKRLGNEKDTRWNTHNPYATMSFVCDYLSIGGKTIEPYLFYPNTQNASRGFSMDLKSPDYRGSSKVDDLLSVNGSSQRFNDAWNTYTPMTTHPVRVEHSSVLDKEGTGDVEKNMAVQNFLTLYLRDAALLENMRTNMGNLADSLYMAFTKKITFASINKLRFDQLRDNLQTLYRTYMNSVKTYSGSKGYMSYNGRLYKVTGNYEIPYSQVMLNVALSGVLPAYIDSQSGLPMSVNAETSKVKNFGANPHRRDNRLWAWYNIKDAGGTLKNYLSYVTDVTFDIWRADAWNVEENELKCIHDSNKRTPFKLDDPYGTNQVTRPKSSR